MKKPNNNFLTIQVIVTVFLLTAGLSWCIWSWALLNECNANSWKSFENITLPWMKTFDDTSCLWKILISIYTSIEWVTLTLHNKCVSWGFCYFMIYLYPSCPVLANIRNISLWCNGMSKDFHTEIIWNLLTNNNRG